MRCASVDRQRVKMRLIKRVQKISPGRIRTCGQNKLHAHLFGEERVDVGFEDQLNN